MTKIPTARGYDLEDRTLKFVQDAIAFVNKLPKSLTNVEMSQQLVKAAGSFGANDIEANESLSKRDFVMRIKIRRKELKKSRYWLKMTIFSKELEEDQ